MTPNQYQKSAIVATTLFFLVVILTTNSFSGETANAVPTAPAAPQAEALPLLPQVTVTGERIAPMTGATILDREMIENLPARNGTITDLLNVAPGVQFSEAANSSFTAGEIKPPEISISGGRPHENNYRIDGVGNNNVTDPAFAEVANPDNLPGRSQTIFLNTSLVERIDVYDHNVPARYGSFTGGVVEARTKVPERSFGGRIFYRRTSDHWTKFHVSEEDREDFDTSSSSAKQPKFTKQQTGFELNTPLTSKSGLLAGYSLNHSDIPLFNLTRRQDQKRRSDNYFLKYVYEPSLGQTLSITTIYAPYTETHFLKTTNHSEFTLGGDNIAVAANYAITGTSGLLNINLGFQNSEDYRRAPNLYRFWLSTIDDNPTSKDWGLLIDSDFSKEGGFGDLKRYQTTISLQTDWVSKPVKLGHTEQIFNLGFAFERIAAELKRPETAFSYSVPKQHLATDIPCLDGDPACIDGEQYLSKRKTSPAGEAQGLVFQYSAYLEDQIQFDRLMLRPGVRISRDTLMDNSNTAPRFAAAYKVSRRLDTTLLAGWNRYYGQNLLVFKLREGIAPYVIDSLPKDAEGNTFYAAYPDLPEEIAAPTNRFTRLKTPYSDELSAGIVQSLFCGELRLDYIRRYYEDQLAKEYIAATPDDSYHYILNNNGSSAYESYRLGWEKQWPTQFLGINATYETTLASNTNYDDRLTEDDLLEPVWYKGARLFPDELPRDDFNRPWTVNLIYSRNIRKHLAFTNVTRYQSHYRTIEDSKDDTEEGLDIYEELRKPSSVTFDWQISQGIPLTGKQLLVLNIDIFNVFNRKTQVGTQNRQFGLGRQIWAGVEYIF
jgi:hypothetical protein